MAAPINRRIAAAPISWGVCEVPDWGYQLMPDTVLNQMAELGVAATEFGPEGFLPDPPAEKSHVLASHSLAAVGQFVPVVLHRPDVDPLPSVEHALQGLVAARAGTIIIAAATGAHGYDDRPVLDEAGWCTLLANLDRIDRMASAQGITAALHPHVGTMIESGDETERALQGSTIGLCLDTGHLLIGGGDPVAFARTYPARIVHCHLKDVRQDLASTVQAGEMAYAEAVRSGMYVPLGAGDIDITTIIQLLESAGYEGWYVLEQDTMLSGDPAQTGVDPLGDVRLSMAFIEQVGASR